MSDREVREALNDGMLDAARDAAAAGRYDEAFEDILTVLSVEEDNGAAHTLLMELVGPFLLKFTSVDVYRSALASRWEEAAKHFGGYEALSQLMLSSLMTRDLPETERSKRYLNFAERRSVLDLARVYCKTVSGEDVPSSEVFVRAEKVFKERARRLSS